MTTSFERRARLRSVVDAALAYVRNNQRSDGSWAIPPEPRVLENALVIHCARRAGVAAELPELEATLDWLRGHPPTDGARHPLARAIERWLWDLATRGTSEGLVLADIGANQAQLNRRKLLVDALSVELGLINGSAAESIRGALSDRLDHAATAKPWSAAEDAALYLIVGGATNLALRERALEIITSAQTETGSIADNPISTALALWGARCARASSMADACLGYLRRVRIGATWRFCTTEVWDTALLTRSLLAAGIDDDLVGSARAFLIDAQRSDGGWAYSRGRDADIDTTAMALCALPKDATDAHRRGREYLLARRDANGLWPTWNDKNDPVAADVVGHAVSVLVNGDGPPTDHERATAWLVQRFETDGAWRADWYENQYYAQYEIGSALGFGHSIVQRIAAGLRDEQRPDGGFAPARDAASSPAATGCALALLGTSVSVDHPAYLRAVDYLLATAQPDGTWPGPTGMFGPRPFVSDYTMQTHALALLGLSGVMRTTSNAVEQLAAVMFPQLTGPWRDVATAFAAWSFAADDVLDELSDVESARVLADQISAREGELGRELGTITAELAALASRRQVSAFVGHVDAFLDACVWEAGNRASQRPPTLETYRHMRPHTGAMWAFIRIVLAAHDVPLAVESASGTCEVLGDIAWLPCLANDLVSVKKELAAGDFHNAIILGYRDGNADAHVDMRASYAAARNSLPARLAATPLDPPARDALWALVTGADQWLTNSERY